MKKLLAFILLLSIVAGCKRDEPGDTPGPPPKGPTAFVQSKFVA